MNTINTINVGGIDQEIEDSVARSKATSSESRLNDVDVILEDLDERIDAIVAPTGTAPNPDEILDARLGVDGVTYNTLGNAIRTQINNRLEKYHDVYKYTGELGSHSETAWYCYPDITLKAGVEHKISFVNGKVRSDAKVALVSKGDLKVMSVNSIAASTILTLTPTADCFPMWFGIYHTSGLTNQPTVMQWQSTSTPSVGQTITLRSGWSYNTMSFGLWITAKYDPYVYEESKLDRYIPEFTYKDYGVVESTVSNAWYAYRDTILYPGESYTVTFDKDIPLGNDAKIAILSVGDNEVFNVYTVTNASVIEIEPTVKSFIMFFGLGYTNDYHSIPIAIRWVSTTTPSVGNAITFDDWTSNRLLFGININRKIKNLNSLNSKVDAYQPLYDYVGAQDSHSEAAWYAYPEVILKAGIEHKISFSRAYDFANGRFALIGVTDNKVKQRWSVSPDTVITYTPSVDVFPMCFGIYWTSNLTDQPTSKVYRSTEQVSVGDLITFDSSWSYNSFSFGFDIKKKFDPFRKKPYVVVSKDGLGDYKSLVEAVASEPSGTTIYVMPGTYDGSVRAYAKELHVIGVDREKCIIRNTNGLRANPPMECSCGHFENLTFYAQYISGTSEEIGTNSGAYAVHCDKAEGNEEIAIGNTLTFQNCNLISDFAPALGVGSFKNWKLSLINCRLTINQPSGRGVYGGSGTLGAFYFHDMNGETGNAKVVVKDCIIENTQLANTMCIYDRQETGVSITFDFVNNTLYSAVSGFTDSIWWRQTETPFAGTFHLSPLSHGNTGTVLNN